MPKWFHPRFSLRFLLILITAACCWLGLRTSQVRQEDHAVAEIRDAGGTVFFCRPFHPQYGRVYASQNRSLSFLKRILVGNGAQNVCTVHLPYDHRIGDREIEKLLPSLSVLHGLRELRLHDTGISSETIDALHALNGLETLDLCITEIDDGAIDGLKRIQNLRYVDIFGTKISIAAASELQAAKPNCLIRGPKRGVGYFGHEQYADAYNN